MKNFFCVTLRVRVLGYIMQQPPSFVFVATLLALATVLPFIGVYIHNTPLLPDIDTMRVCLNGCATWREKERERERERERIRGGREREGKITVL